MQLFPPTVVLRHRKENLKKCSLRGLEENVNFNFFTYPYDRLPDLSNYIMLTLDAPELSKKDTDLGLFILDATWRYADVMLKQMEESASVMIKRSLPSHFRTAYPRRQNDCVDPERGLASIEAIFAAYHLLGRPTDGLLDNYHWKEAFLLKNNIG